MNQLLSTALAILFVCSAQVQAQAKPKPASPKLGATTQAKVKAKSPNAADLYLMAIAELRKALHDPTKALHDPAGELWGLPDDLGERITDPSDKPWREAAIKSAVAISLFAQASQIPRCQFDRYPKDLATGLSRKILEFHTMIQVVSAHGWQQTEHAPSGALMTGLQMLQYANHCAQDHILLGLALGLDAEERAADLLKAAVSKLARQDQGLVSAGGFLKQLEAHLSCRLSSAVIADIAEHDFAFMIKHGVSEKFDANPALIYAKKRATEMVGEMVLPLRQNPAMSLEAFRAHWAKRIKALKKLTKGKKADDLLANGVGESLAAILVLVAGPANLSDLLEACRKNGKALQICAEDLRKLIGGE